MPAPSRRKPVSVVMPVHNAMPHLDEAVTSILGQTFGDFEFVIYDDASTDGSRTRLREWATIDKRIRLFEGDWNLGPVGSSAFVVEQSSSSLIARMDADDICSADRLEQQLRVLSERPKAGLVGTLFEIIDDQGRRVRGPDYWRLTRSSGFVPFAAHGSIMFRRSVFEEVGGYRPECEFWEDQDLVVRMASAAEVWVIPRALYKVRQWSSNTRAKSDSDRVERAIDLMYRSVSALQENRSYEDVLRNRAMTGSRVDPRVFISTGSLLLWAGERPQLFLRLLRRGKLGMDKHTAAALIWTAWASISPSSLRSFVKLLIRRRNAKAAYIPDQPVRWKPHQQGAEGRGRVEEPRSRRSTRITARP